MTTTIQHLRCRSCGAPITWTTTEGGERMPCDAHPVAGERFGVWGGTSARERRTMRNPRSVGAS